MDNKEKKDILLNIITGIAITSVIGSSLWCMSLVSKETTAQTTTQEPVKIEQLKVEDKQVAKTIKNKNYTEQECSFLEYRMDDFLFNNCNVVDAEKEFSAYLSDYYSNCKDKDSLGNDLNYTLMCCELSIASNLYNNQDYKNTINYILQAFSTETKSSKNNPNKDLYLDYLSNSYFYTNDNQNAKKYIEILLQSNSNKTFKTYKLAGDIYFNLNEKENAKKYYKLALYKVEQIAPHLNYEIDYLNTMLNSLD